MGGCKQQPTELNKTDYTFHLLAQAEHSYYYIYWKNYVPQNLDYFTISLTPFQD